MDTPKPKGGKRPGAGRKPKVQEQAAIDFMSAAWPLSRRRKAVRKMADEAEGGNVKAAALLLAYAYGKPKEQIEHSGEIKGQAPVLNVILASKQRD